MSADLHETSSDKVHPEGGKVDETSFSNQVLCKRSNNLVEYHLPTYLRMTIRKIHHIDLENSVAQVSALLIFSVYYGGTPEVKLDDGSLSSDWIVEELSERNGNLSQRAAAGHLRQQQGHLYRDRSETLP